MVFLFWCLISIFSHSRKGVDPVPHPCPSESEVAPDECGRWQREDPGRHFRSLYRSSPRARTAARPCWLRRSPLELTPPSAACWSEAARPCRRDRSEPGRRSGRCGGAGLVSGDKEPLRAAQAWRSTGGTQFWLPRRHLKSFRDRPIPCVPEQSCPQTKHSLGWGLRKWSQRKVSNIKVQLGMTKEILHRTGTENTRDSHDLYHGKD
jgi:hypothetical protein